MLLPSRIKTYGAPRCVTLVCELTPRFAEFPTAEGVPELLARTAA